MNYNMKNLINNIKGIVKKPLVKAMPYLITGGLFLSSCGINNQLIKYHANKNKQLTENLINYIQENKKELIEKNSSRGTYQLNHPESEIGVIVKDTAEIKTLSYIFEDHNLVIVDKKPYGFEELDEVVPWNSEPKKIVYFKDLSKEDQLNFIKASNMTMKKILYNK